LTSWATIRVSGRDSAPWSWLAPNLIKSSSSLQNMKNIWWILYFGLFCPCRSTCPSATSLCSSPLVGLVDLDDMDLLEIGCDSVEWIQLAQDRVQWRNLLNTAINFSVQWKREMPWSSDKLSASQEGFHLFDRVLIRPTSRSGDYDRLVCFRRSSARELWIYAVQDMHPTGPRRSASHCAVVVCMECVSAQTLATASQAIRATAATLVRDVVRYEVQCCYIIIM
jgi:hypothetical protein